MAFRLANRGPDEEGVWCDSDKGLALGHRRLSIIDLTPTGRQPMESFCGRYVIVLNGEIYNFDTLRKEMEKENVPFRGRSDTEVVLAAVSLWGVRKALERFVGMFAFTLWDKRERTLILARDRMGEKPLYYGTAGSAFLFASTLKALKAHPSWRGEIDRDAACLFLRHNYIPGPYSIYRGFFKLPPGTYLTLNAAVFSKGAPLPEPENYWSLRYVMEEGGFSEFEEGQEEVELHLERLLLDSVKGQMMADVPLGAFLSGGIDSSTVVAMMQSLSSRPVKTFTIGFHESGYNEAEHAKSVARHLGTEHTEMYITHEEALSVVPKLPALYDEPFADSSQIPTFLVCRLARRHVTVSLSGDAGDELFAGYGNYTRCAALWRNIARIPGFVRKRVSADSLESCLKSLFFRFRGGQKMLRRSMKILRMLSCSSREECYRLFLSQTHEPSAFVAGGSEPTSMLADTASVLKGADFIRQMQYLDMISYLPDDILVKVDRAAMGISLETRVPFLDHRIVEFAARLPLQMKLEGNTGKMILRKVLYKYVPKELIDRPKKGFSVPMAAWLRGPLKEWASDLLSPAQVEKEGLLRAGSIQEKWKEHLSGKTDWSELLWSILMLRAWLEEDK
jgi:asparagine synthase (glutamine-hydrolysing)